MKLGTVLQHIFVYLWPVNAVFEANEEHDFEPFHPEPNSDPGGLKKPEPTQRARLCNTSSCVSRFLGKHWLHGHEVSRLSNLCFFPMNQSYLGPWIKSLNILNFGFDSVELFAFYVSKNRNLYSYKAKHSKRGLFNMQHFVLYISTVKELILIFSKLIL